MGNPLSLPYKTIGIAVGAVLAALAIYFAIHAYGKARYDAGVSDTDAQWHAAAEKLAKASHVAAGAAEDKAERRAEVYAIRLEEEKEEIEDALAQGADPVDVLFPTRGVRDGAGGGAPTP